MVCATRMRSVSPLRGAQARLARLGALSAAPYVLRWKLEKSSSSATLNTALNSHDSKPLQPLAACRRRNGTQHRKLRGRSLRQSGARARLAASHTPEDKLHDLPVGDEELEHLARPLANGA